MSELGEGDSPPAPPTPAATHKPGHLKLTSETVATAPSDRARLKIGVGEKVRLTTTGATGTIAWTVSGSSTLSSNSGASTRLTAHERAESTTVTATDTCSCKLSLTFTVVEPSGVLMERAPGTGVWHAQGIPSVGIKTSIFITPADVSFENIEIEEDDAVAIVTGYFVGSPIDGIHHAGHGAGVWAPVGAVVAGKGSKVLGTDNPSSGHCNFGLPYKVGGFDWPIPWQFRVSGGAGKVFTTAHHLMTIDATGAMTIAKAGASGAAALNAASSSY